MVVSYQSKYTNSQVAASHQEPLETPEGAFKTKNQHNHHITSIHTVKQMRHFYNLECSQMFYNLNHHPKVIW